MADSRPKVIVLDLDELAPLTAGIAAPSGRANYMHNMVRDQNHLRNFGKWIQYWAEPWLPDPPAVEPFTWTAEDVAGIGTKTYALLADAYGNLLLQSDDYVDRYSYMYCPGDDPSHDMSVPSAEEWAARPWFTDCGSVLLVSGGGRRVASSKGDRVRFAPMYWDGTAKHLTVNVANSVDVTVTAGMEDADWGVSIKKGDRITVTNPTTGAHETRTIVHYVKLGGTTWHAYTDRAFSLGSITGAKAVTARLHYLGIEAPIPAPAGVVGAHVGGLSVGAYLYKLVYKYSARSVTSNAGPQSSTVTVSALTDTQVTLSGWDVEPVDARTSKHGLFQADQIEIYRTTADGTVFYLLTTLARDQGTSPNSFKFVTSYVDQVTDAVLVTHAVFAATYRDPAPPIETPVFFNGSLWGAHSITEGWCYKSSVKQLDYWQLSDPPAGLARTDIGHRLRISSSADPIRRIIPEVGAYSNTGRTGSNLLVMTARRAYRIFGDNASNIRVESAFDEGCIAPRSVVNCGGYICWVSRNGTRGIPAGGSVPDRLIGEKIKPIFETAPAITGIDGGDGYTVAAVESWGAWCVACFWQGWYMLSYYGYRGGAGSNDTTAIYDLAAGKWIGTCDVAATGFHVCEGAVFGGNAGAAGSLTYANGLVGESDPIALYRFEDIIPRNGHGNHYTDADPHGDGTTGVSWRVFTPPLIVRPDAHGVIQRWTFSRLVVVLEVIGGDLTLTADGWGVGMLSDGPGGSYEGEGVIGVGTADGAPSWTETRSIPGYVSPIFAEGEGDPVPIVSDHHPLLIEFRPNMIARFPQIGLRGQSTGEVKILLVQAEFMEHNTDSIEPVPAPSA